MKGETKQKCQQLRLRRKNNRHGRQADWYSGLKYEN